MLLATCLAPGCCRNAGDRGSLAALPFVPIGSAGAAGLLLAAAAVFARLRASGRAEPAAFATQPS
jgi:hypothetical protein